MKILGIDPGKSGAIALIGDGFLSVHDMPTFGSGTKSQVDAANLATLINRLDPHIAIIESVHAMPKQGVSSSFAFGRSFGVAEGVILGMGIPLHYVSPAKWKRAIGVTADKETSRVLAIQLYPHIADQMARKKDNGRAEALLIARWCEQTSNGAQK